jgi:hypothetical protein
LYESKDLYIGNLFISEFLLSLPYKFFASEISSDNCMAYAKPKIEEIAYNRYNHVK